METTNNQNNTKIAIASALTLVGCTLVGLGIGIMVGAVWTYTIIGVGTSFLLSAAIFWKNFNRKSDTL